MTSTVLWALHVRGPDNVLAMPDYETAVAFADWLTAVDRGNMADELCPLFAALPCEWPWSAERHAADIAHRVTAPAHQRDYPIDVPRATSLVELTEVARKHPLCKFGARVKAEGGAS